MPGTPSAWLPVLVLDFVLVLDLPLRGQHASRRVEIEDEIEDEKSRDGFPKTRGHPPGAGDLDTRQSFRFNCGVGGSFGAARPAHNVEGSAMGLANLLTISRMALAPVLLLVFLIGTTVSDLVVLLIVGHALASDLLDGYVARRMDGASTFGKIMDPLADSFTFLALFGCFVVAGWMPIWVFAIFLFRETFMHMFLRPYFLLRGVALAAKRSGKLKTVVQSIVGVAGLVAIAAVRLWPAAMGPCEPTLRLIAVCLFLVTALWSVSSLRPYVAELRNVPSRAG